MTVICYAPEAANPARIESEMIIERDDPDGFGWRCLPVRESGRR